MADQQQLEDAEYLLAHTGREVERLSMQHAWIQKSLDGRIVFAPVDLQRPGLRVLDVGCADGILLRDLQKQVHPSAQLVGVDIMPSFFPTPETSPSESGNNIRYALQDICKPFTPDLVSAFDLTHVRYVLIGTASVGIPAAVKNLVTSLAPDGWLQIQELFVADDAPGDTPAMKDFKVVFRTLLEKIGMDVGFAAGLAEVFKEAGLENVECKKVRYPVGKSAGNEEDSGNSILPFKLTVPTMVESVESLGASLPASVTENLGERFESEMASVGGFFESYIVWGQKPL